MPLEQEPVRPVDHPLRAMLNDEVHARPSMRINSPARITHVAQLTGELARDRSHLAALCQAHGLPEPPADARQVQLEVEGRRVKWERHTEFTSVMVVETVPDADGDDWSALTPALADWIARLPGERLAAVHLKLEVDTEPFHGPESLALYFPSGDVVGSIVHGGDALVWTDFRMGPDGHVRILVRNVALSPNRSGRLVQRLLEVETYRMMALMGLIPARESGRPLARMEQRLAEIVARTAAPDTAGDAAEEHRLLDELTRLAAEAEALSSRCRYRFSATAAYAELVEQRIGGLREERIKGLQRLGSFLERRFRPAVRTCEAVARRQEDLADGIARASGLLRTRVDVHRAEQNAEILKSLEERTAAQVRIQEAVEGLSVFAIAYYLLGLGKYMVEGLPALGVHFPKETMGALAVPVVIAAVWLGVRRLRKALGNSEEK
ncbi:DUF3422 domain-containing protein [Aerophototrophica crusticola]|uniref:DUF3422 domain-containing protein n=1 Tax=Aerophototrophica crusticola TaxID=1709002 RepID=A0A858R589_9PROT|nr:DUF3422 domain-containing protein [Rhodospirillaceae bacterium B3]